MRKFLFLAIIMCAVAATVSAQTRKISGQVIDDKTGNPFAGVSVMEAGTSNGTTTDQDGKFSLNVPAKGKVVLNITRTGYAEQSITVNKQSGYSVRLIEEVQQLSDVVVIGYGTVRKKDLTGAVGVIGSADIVRSNPTNAEQALQGQVPGVVITKSSNLPGQAFSMDIRGESTITGVTEPLVVIDGVVGGRLQDINPADIQSIDVLKDASSTAIYGSRGANGVIIITSKKGRSGKTKISIDSYIGQKTPAHLPQFQTAQQFYKSQYTDAVLNNGSPATFTVNELNTINTGASTNWVDLMTKPSMKTGSTVAVSGGSAGTTFRFSGGYLEDDGNIPHDFYKRYSLNGAVDSKVNNFIRVGITAYLNYSSNPTGSLEALRSAYRARPTGVANYADLINPGAGPDLAQGPWNGYAVWMGINDSQVMNPLVESNPANSLFTVKAANEMGSAFAEITLMKGLTFRSTIQASNIDTHQGDYRGTYTKDRAGKNPPRATYTANDLLSWTLDNQLSYNHSFGKSKISATALQSAYKSTTETYVIAVTNLPFASEWYNLGTAPNANTNVSSNYIQSTLESYMGRINYSYDDKYLLTLTGRGDGASQLANGNKWAFFPSGAFAWRAGQEKFISNTKIFTDLKFRASYGQVGNANVSPYSTQAQILNTVYSYGATAASGFAPGTLANSALKWERSEELNFGLDMGFFNNRITGSVDVYWKNTKDLILNENIPTSSGFSTVTANVGKVSNHGVELLLNTVNVINKNFSWRTTYTFSKNINKIVSLANGVPSITSGGLYYAVGHQVKSYYDYKYAGVWQITDSLQAKVYNQIPGQAKVVDENNDNKISSSPGIDDRMILGTQLPNYIMGMTNRITYKDFDLSFLLYYRNGTLYNNGLLSGTMGDYTNNRYNHIIKNYWTRNNPTNDYYGVDISQPYKSSVNYQDASFLRVSDITVGYTMPKVKLDKYSIDGLRLYVQITNPFVFTKNQWMDPEFNGNTYIDDVPYAVYTFGINLGF